MTVAARVVATGAHIGGGIGSGDVFHHDAQAGHGCAQRFQHPLDEHGLAVENVDIWVRHLAVDAQRKTDFGHAFQHRHNTGDIAHTGIGIGGGSGWVKLHGLD